MSEVTIGAAYLAFRFECVEILHAQHVLSSRWVGGICLWVHIMCSGCLVRFGFGCLVTAYGVCLWMYIS